MKNQDTNDKTIWFLIAFVLLFAGIKFYNFIIEKNEYGSSISLYNFSHKRDPKFIYKKAEEYLDDELYEKSYEEFNKILDYEDSKIKAQNIKKTLEELESRYEKGKTLFENKDYLEAYKQLINCSKYKNAKEMCKQCDAIFFEDIDRELNKIGIEMITCPSPDGIGFFRLAKYELTKLQYSKIFPYSFGHGQGRTPIAITFKAAQEVCDTLNKKYKNTLPADYKFALPSEEQWKFACTAGKKKERAKKLDSIAWHIDNSNDMPHPVGSKKPNAWGFYDMIGNMWECCDKVIYDYRYNRKSRKKEKIIVNVSLKGGSYCSPGRLCNASSSPDNSIAPTTHYINVGLRIALIPVE